MAAHSPHQMVSLVLKNICNLKMPYKEKSAISYCGSIPSLPFSENTQLSMAKKVTKENVYKCILFSFLWMSDEIMLSGNV